MADYDLFQIEITKNYTKNEWREDIKKVGIKYDRLLELDEFIAHSTAQRCDKS
jgi:hypothetical protein